MTDDESVSVYSLLFDILFYLLIYMKVMIKCDIEQVLRSRGDIQMCQVQV